MEITFAPRGYLQIDNARITFRNFEGRGDIYNREGDRNFALIVPNAELAEALIAEGWNVKIKPPREEGEDPFMYMNVKVKFNDYGPAVYLVSGGNKRELNEDTVKCLDNIRIDSVNLDIRPYDWVRFEGTANEKRGRSAYLQAIEVYQGETNRFAPRHEEEDGVPF